MSDAARTNGYEDKGSGRGDGQGSGGDWDDSEDQEAPQPKPTLRARIKTLLANLQFVTYTTLTVVLLILCFLWPRMFISVPTGHHAVMYRFLSGGTVTDRVWQEGLNIIPPWDSLTIYETRLLEQKIAYDVLSEEGLDLGVAVSVRFRPYIQMLGFLHKDIGPNYYERLIKPEVKAHLRRTFGNRPAQEIYSSSRDILQELATIPSLGRLEDEGGNIDARPYVHIQELKLIDIELPNIVKDAIAEKYRQEQLMLEYRSRLKREEQESERKRTEAAGIRDLNLIAGRVSPDLLRWRGIDATVELAKSQNTKVLVLGSPQGGLPVIMNLDGPPGTAPQGAVNDKAPQGAVKDNAAAPAPQAAPIGPPAPPAAASP